MSQRIIEALQALDVQNDNHWTGDGLPRVDTVRLLTGDSQLSREDLTLALPGFSRYSDRSLATPVAAAPEAAQQPEQQPAQPPQGAAIVGEPEQPYDRELRKLHALQAQLNDLTREVAQQQVIVDALVIAGAQDSDHPMQSVQGYLANQRKLLDERRARQDALRGVDIKSLLPARAPIDSAMARKTGRGGQRPLR